MQKHKREDVYLKRCEVCRKKFDKRIRKCSDVCSPECAKKRKALQDAKLKKGRGVVGSKAKCAREGCEVTFPRASGTQKYCCPRCAYLAKRARDIGVQARVMCVQCGEPFMRSKYSKRDTCSDECLTEYKKTVQPNKKKNKDEILDTKPWNHAISTDFYAMETGCPEYRSWDCPEMDPITTRHVATVEEVWANWKPKRRGRKDVL